jgi:PAN-like domain
MHQLDNLYMWPDNIVVVDGLSEENCKLFCLNNCLCVAFASQEYYCYHWYGEMFNITINNHVQGLSIYIRLAISKFYNQRD